MSARPAASGSISFGMVSVPVKFYTAASNESVSFRMITPSGNPLKQKYVDPIDGQEYAFKDCNKGFEVEPNKFVIFSQEEVKALESGGTKGCCSIEQFVPIESVDLVQVESSYYLKPDKGGDKAFKLLASAMATKNSAAVGQWTNRGKDHLVVIRPYKGGMILHTLYYKNEVRDYDDNCAVLPISDAERQLASQLIDMLSVPAFDSSRFHDQFTSRVMAAVEAKRTNPDSQVTVANTPATAPMDLFAALKASLGTGLVEPTSKPGLVEPAAGPVVDKKPSKPHTKRAKK